MYKTINICHIVSGDLWAGAESMCYNLFVNLNKYNDISLTVLLLNKGMLYSLLCDAGVHTLLYDEHKYSFIGLFKKVRLFLQNNNFDIIHSHRYKENMLVLLSTIGSDNVKLITTKHGLPESYKGIKGYRSQLYFKLDYYIVKNYFDYLISVSEDIRKYLEINYNFSSERIHAIHNGVIVPDNTRNIVNDKYFTIGSSGRLVKIKDYPLMINVACEILNKIDYVKFKLAGEGPEYQYLKDLVYKRGIENNFILCGYKKDIYKFYEQIDLFLNTSLHEGISLSVLEAMGYGVPAISTNVGGMSEIIRDGVEGFLINNRNPKSIADKCIDLIYNRDLLRKFSIASRKRVIESFSAFCMSKKYYKFYKSLIF